MQRRSSSVLPRRRCSDEKSRNSFNEHRQWNIPSTEQWVMALILSMKTIHFSSKRKWAACSIQRPVGRLNAHSNEPSKMRNHLADRRWRTLHAVDDRFFSFSLSFDARSDPLIIFFGCLFVKGEDQSRCSARVFGSLCFVVDCTSQYILSMLSQAMC